MGKKNKKNKLDKDGNKNCQYPFVSICTPTFNRRPFFEYTIKCFQHQDYPKDRMEWIIIDDGTDPIEDMILNIPQVKYYKYDTKMSLGKKRNLMHEKSCGEIIVYMDDDDYYPPERVSHAVNMLKTHPNAMCAGSSEIYIYFKHIDKMYQFGPYGPNHATAGTFAFKRELLKNHRYNDTAALAEEKEFLKNYTVPFVQLEPKKTILVFSHRHNTFDKKKLLENGDNQMQKPSDKTVDYFIKDPEFKEFYMNSIERLLIDYEPGDPKMKPDVLQQIQEIEKTREEHIKTMKSMNNGQISINRNGQNIPLNNDQVVGILQKQQSQLQELVKTLTERDKTIELLKVKENNLNENVKKLITILLNKDNEINELKSKLNQ